MTPLLPASKGRAVSLVLLVAFFIAAGGNHFVHPDFYLAMMPDDLPAHQLLVDVSGVCEVLGGVGALLPVTRRAAGFGLVALLIAVFPANLNMALHPAQFPDIPVAALYLRLPLQLVMIAWVMWSTSLRGRRTGA